MTDQPDRSQDPNQWRGPEQTDQPLPPPAAEPAASDEPQESRTFEQRMDDFGHRAEAAGERFGREAEAAADRWKRDPALVAAGDTAARIWGLLVLLVGLWFFADFTLGYDMPAVAWGDVWPLALIVVGLAVVLRGLARRRA